MKTQADVLSAVKAGRESDCIDGRDYSRLAEYFPVEELKTFGFGLKEGVEPQNYNQHEWTEANVLAQLRDDVAFGFEKAIDKRGISAGLMYSVVKMWMWVLDDPLESFEQYANYGLPLFKAVALKYGFDNPIGDDAGTEFKYETYGS